MILIDNDPRRILQISMRDKPVRESLFKRPVSKESESGFLEASRVLRRFIQ